MLPDYPQIKQKIQKKFNELVSKKSQEYPFFFKIKNTYIHEGNALTTSDVDGYSKSGGYQQISAPFNIDPKEMIDNGPEALFSKIPEICMELGQQKSEIMIKEMDMVTKRTGNIVNTTSKSISAENYLRCLETLAIPFDKTGTAILPDLLLPSKNFDKMNEDIFKWKADPDFQKKLGVLLEKKRKEWIDRESRRKLVD